MLYQNITSGFTCLYFWKCVWSEAACFTVAQRKQVCAGLWETEQPSLLSGRQSELGVPKWEGKQRLLCHAVSQNYQVPVIFHELSNRQNFKCWASSEDTLAYEVCLHICWVAVQKSGCSQESIHSFHRRDWGNEMHGERVRVRTSILNILRRDKTKRKKATFLAFDHGQL